MPAVPDKERKEYTKQPLALWLQMHVCISEWLLHLKTVVYAYCEDLEKEQSIKKKDRNTADSSITKKLI